MASNRNVLVPYLVDVVGPFLAYAIVHWLGAPAFWALTAGGLVAGTSTAINTVRRRGLDSVGMLVLLEILVSLVLLVTVHDERLMLIRPSFYTLVAAVYLLYTAAAGRPLTFEAARPIATKGDPSRNASYDQAWATSAEFRRIHTMVTTGFGVALIADSALRVVIVYTTPVDRSMWLSNVPHTVAMILFLVVSAMAGRKFKKLVAGAQGAEGASTVGRDFSPADCDRFSRMDLTTISRRTFLAMAGTLPFAARLGAAGSSVPVGIELYTVRDALAKDLMGTVRAVAKMGYQVVEFYSPYYQWTPQMAADVRKLMDDLGIACHSTHNDHTALEEAGIQKAIELNHAIGSKYIIMASAGQVNGLDGWKGVADKLTAAQAKLEPLGMGAGYHNHGAEWHEVDGKRPIDVIATGTPKSVTLQFDIGTAVEAGVDPEGWITANPGRIRSIHCKDWKSGGVGYAAIFGEGDAPWAKIFKAAESVGGVEYYLIEQEAGPSDQQLARAERCLANWRKLRA